MITPIELRHIIHQNPELSFQEFNTTKLLIDNISELKAPVLKIHTPLQTGCIVEYRINDGEFFLFRADIDALPVKEETDCPFKSCNNFMHACGHDVHTSILYGFLQYVVEHRIEQNILFLFQPAEELGAGAKKFLDTKIFDSFNIARAFALHVIDEYPEGTVASTGGALFASSIELNVEFFGVNTHIAFPQKGKNALNALRSYLDMIDRIPLNPLEPFVYGTGRVVSGTVRNIIPAHAIAECAIRSLSLKKNREYLQKFRGILEGIKVMTDVDYKLTEGEVCPEVLVDSNMYDMAEKIFSKKYNFIDCGYKMTAEDFSYISHNYPSFMFWLGTGRGNTVGLHNSKFLPDDSVIEQGIEIFTELIFGFQRKS